jgi:anti-sigma regulatory factor (Ser/Thr protein kinase)
MVDGLDGLAPPSSDALEDAVVALDELMSNGIRHGRAPVEVEICVCDHGLLVLVSDRASEQPPRPTSTRDPAQGGMGLGIVARASTASGWFSQEDVKVVWAVMPDGSHE